LPITLHLRLDSYHCSRCLQPANTHPPFDVSSEHLILQASNRLLEGSSLTLKPPVSIDFGPEGPIANLTYSLVHIVVSHVVSVKKPKYVVSDRRGRNVDVDYGCGVNLAVVGGAVKGETSLYKGVRSVKVCPDITRRCQFGYGMGCRPALGYAQSPAESAMRVGERFGMVESAACERGARYLVEAGVDYLGLDLLAYLFDCIDPALRQR
jgi:hypothetical protein